MKKIESTFDIEEIFGKYYDSIRHEIGIDSINISFHFNWDDTWVLVLEVSNVHVKYVIKNSVSINSTKKINIDSVRSSIKEFVQKRGDQLVDEGVVKRSYIGWISKLLGNDNMTDRIENMLIFVRLK